MTQDANGQASHSTFVLRIGTIQAIGTDAAVDQEQAVARRDRELPIDGRVDPAEPAVAAGAAAERIGGVADLKGACRGYRMHYGAFATPAACLCASSHFGGRPRRGRSSSQRTGGYTQTVLTSSGYTLPPQVGHRRQHQSAISTARD